MERLANITLPERADRSVGTVHVGRSAKDDTFSAFKTVGRSSSSR